MSLEFERVITANWGDDSVRSLAGYEAKGGYAGLRAALDMAPDDVIGVVKDSGLRGRGGAGFPTGMKWSFVPQDTGKPTYVTVNFDESEPGTCNNRELMEREPHQMLEGAMIAAYAIRCHTVFVYCRGEFLWPGTVVQRAIAELYDKGYAGKGILGSDYDLDIVMHRGAGAYICGEETALLSSLEGFRGQPRLRPPFPAVEGLYESPTVINNVETLCNVPHIVKRGADWFKSQGTEKAPGTKMFTISGKVERPGNYELPLGTPFRVLLEEYAGGMLGGGALKAWTPGGSSTPMLTAEHLDVGLDFESIAAVGSLLGTGACMVMDQSDCIVEAARRLVEFYAHESCGKCTPCREGTWWAERVLGRIEEGYGRAEDMPLLSEVGGNILFRAFCALADGAVSPISSTLQYFMDEYEAHVELGRCPMSPEPVDAGVARVVSARMVTLTIDGKEVTVPSGTLIIRAAEQLGIEIPRFCDHPLLDPVGACRQCYVEIEGQRKLFTSCTTTVAPGMVVMTQNTSPQVQDAQMANLEFLLLNHPLDCPICDRGGECPLQDQALAFGPGESRYIEAKRTYPKPLALSPLVGLDRERCVLCARCTRFWIKISGDRFIELFDRGAGEQVSIAPGEDFRSPFSGNTVQICPVGALTATPYRFVARPFDLSSVDTICPHCSAGCNIKLDMRRGEVVRQLARDNLAVNDAWLCDKGRFAFRFPDSPDRVTTPLIRDHGLEPASFGEVLTEIAGWCAGKRVAFLTGGRLMDEDYYALSKLARTVFGTNDLDHRRDEGTGFGTFDGVAEPVTYDDVERARVILVAGLDAEQEVPILHLRLRKAARRGAKIFVLHPRRTRLHDVAEHILCRPGDEAWLLEMEDGGHRPEIQAAFDALREAGDAGLVIAGPRLADHALGVPSASALAAETGARFAYVTRRANDRGALVAGVHPQLLPGGRRFSLGEERDEVETLWGPIIVGDEGRNWWGILEACVARDVDVLFVIGVDPLRDYPDAALATQAMQNVERVVVQSLELGTLQPYADAFLPAAAFLEKEGHVTTWEGRSQRIAPIRGAAGISLPDWEIFASLALASGGDLGFETLDELRDEMGRLLAPREPAGRWVGDGAASQRIGGEGELVLFTYPLLVDEGRLSERSDELKAALEDEPFLEIHPSDAALRNVVDRGRATVRTAAGQAELPVRVTDHVAEGSVFVPFNQPGFAANTILNGSFSIAAVVEPADTPAGELESAEAAAGGES